MSYFNHEKYRIQKHCRNTSWQFLIDMQIDKLPVNINDIVKRLDIKVIRDSTVNALNQSRSGMTAFIDNEFYIIYNDAEPPQRCRYTIMHEIGHIIFGDIGKALQCNSYVTRCNADVTVNYEEYAADAFAYHVLAPAVVLWGLNVHTPEEISEICNISMESAKYRSIRMEALYKRNQFLKHPLEREVYKQFEYFIEIQHERIR